MIELGDSRVPERIWRKVSVQESGCWHWIGCINKQGYGYATGMRRSPNTGLIMPDLVYRIICDCIWGPAESGQQHDHECHNRDRERCRGGPSCLHRRCVNPAHIVRKSGRDNVLSGNGPSALHLRQEGCVNGHPFTPENTYRRPDKPSHRACRRCKADREAARYHLRMDTDPEFRVNERQRRMNRRKAVDPVGHERRMAQDRARRVRRAASTSPA